jgi:hypothetical protein
MTGKRVAQIAFTPKHSVIKLLGVAHTAVWGGFEFRRVAGSLPTAATTRD